MIKFDFFNLVSFSFVQKILNGSCKWSIIGFQPWEKCGGKIMDYEDDVIPMISYLPLCYSKTQNIAFSDTKFLTRYIFPYAGYINTFFMFIQYTSLSFITIFVTLISEIPQFFDIKKKTTFIGKFKFIFSVKNQIIFLSIISSIVPSLTVFISMFVDFSLFDGFGNMFAFFIVCAQYIQIITLW